MDGRKKADGSWTAAVDAGKKARGAIGAAFLALLVFIGIWSAYYTVEPEENALVLRFGKHVSTAGPGLHFKLPFGVDRVRKVPVTEVRKLEFGFGTAQAGVRTEYRPSTSEDEETSLMLTGDLNIIDVEWVVQYQISDPVLYVFRVGDPEQAIIDLAEASMRAVVGDRSIDQVLRFRESIAEAMQDDLQKSLDEYEAGVRIVTVQLQDVTPPQKVQNSFNEVNKAQQERSRLENEALQEYNRVIPLAKGEAKKRIAQAEGYELDRVNHAKGEISRYTELLAAYSESPEVTRKRLYLETIEEVLPKVRRIVIANDEAILKLLPLDGAGGGR